MGLNINMNLSNLALNNKENSDVSLEDNIWPNISDKLLATVGKSVYNSWFSKIKHVEMEGNVLIIKVSNSFVRDWIIRNYKKSILDISKSSYEKIFDISIIVDKSVNTNITHNVDPLKNKNSTDEKIQNSYTKTSLDARFTFDNFIVGKSNEFAYAAAKRICESSLSGGQLPFNPLFLYGGVGLGKTHLMHAIATQIKNTNPNKKVVYLSAEKFMYYFIKAVRFRDMVSFKDQLRSVDVLMVDDFQFISGKESTQEEFFHTFNELINDNRQIVISADKSPSDLEGLEERIRSRLGWGLVADLHPTTYELRIGILQAKVAQLGIICSCDVLELLAQKINTNVRELEGALTKLSVHSSLSKKAINIEMVNDVLRDLIKAKKQICIDMDKIQSKVCEFFGIKLIDIRSSKRTRALSRPRQIAMYFAKKLTTMSLPEIGRSFGGRDHTTVLHAVRNIEKLSNSDNDLLEDIKLLENSFLNN